MNPDRRRAFEVSIGLFLMGLGLLVILLNSITTTPDVTVSILGLAITVVGGAVYR